LSYSCTGTAKRIGADHDKLATLCMSDRVPDQPIRGTDVCAIVVTYRPDAAFPARLSGVSPQVGMTVIVDNGSSDAERSMLREAASDPNIDLVFNAENLGLARALNIGIQRAATLGYSWVLLLDQDTRVELDMVGTLLAIHASFPDRERLAVLGSNFSDATERPTDAAGHESPGEHWEEVERIITSGSLLPLETHFAIGPFREEFFIDYVDEEYCLRAKAKGYRIIKSRKHLMSHAIGSPTVRKMFGTSKWTTNHAPDRRYYIARNNTVLLREYGGYRAGMWAWKSFRRCLRQCKRIALYEQMKTRKIAAVIHGLWDGIRGNMGPRNPQPGTSAAAPNAMPSVASGRKTPGEYARKRQTRPAA
jgi:rhamnosyltransferase